MPLIIILFLSTLLVFVEDLADGPIKSAKSDRQRLNGAVNENEEAPVPRVYSG